MNVSANVRVAQLEASRAKLKAKNKILMGEKRVLFNRISELTQIRLASKDVASRAVSFLDKSDFKSAIVDDATDCIEDGKLKATWLTEALGIIGEASGLAGSTCQVQTDALASYMPGIRFAMTDDDEQDVEELWVPRGKKRLHDWLEGKFHATKGEPRAKKAKMVKPLVESPGGTIYISS